MTFKEKKVTGEFNTHTGYIISKHLTHIGYIVTSSNLLELYLICIRILGEEVRKIVKRQIFLRARQDRK